MSNNSPAPVRLRPVIGEAIGTTAFFRNRCLFNTLLDEMKSSEKTRIQVLFHACSIGAEVYTFVIQYLERRLDKNFDLQCFATDKQTTFTQYASQARYPSHIIEGCRESEKKFFWLNADDAEITHEVRQRVTFLPATDFANFTSQECFDAVVLLNAFVYVPQAIQTTAIQNICGYNSRWFVTTGFHQDTITNDLKRHGYQPILTNIEEIHSSWSDRLTPTPVPPESLPPNIFTDWSLRPFSKIEDYEYRYCALFTKS